MIYVCVNARRAGRAEPRCGRRRRERRPALFKGVHLDLAHALARDAEFLRQLFQSDRVLGEPPRLENTPLARVQHVERANERQMPVTARTRRKCKRQRHRHVLRDDPRWQVTALHTFEPVQVAGSSGALIQGNNGNFYGTDIGGGNGAGTIYEATPEGAVTVLYTFCLERTARMDPLPTEQ